MTPGNIYPLNWFPVIDSAFISIENPGRVGGM